MREQRAGAPALLLFWAVAALGGAVMGGAGCGAAVDAEGRPVTGDVWFDQHGVAHCPFCLPQTKLQPTPEESAASVVPRFANLCAKGHPVRWRAEMVPCWRCDGAVRCPECGGSGIDPVRPGRLPCPTCAVTDPTGRIRGSGACQECGGEGFIRYGAMGAER
ncbi:MAG: hypothetical protein KatS3mg102_2400 [Planctomycetota bacterium]|nr:MAG: hypothetical protein KatS3mg102_2400 [Planctomycetota bacterium]